jgi:hypothetical protein
MQSYFFIKRLDIIKTHTAVLMITHNEKQPTDLVLKQNIVDHEKMLMIADPPSAVHIMQSYELYS